MLRPGKRGRYTGAGRDAGMDEELSRGRKLRLIAYIVGAFLVLGAGLVLGAQILSP